MNKNVYKLVTTISKCKRTIRLKVQRPVLLVLTSQVIRHKVIQYV